MKKRVFPLLCAALLLYAGSFGAARAETAGEEPSAQKPAAAAYIKETVLRHLNETAAEPAAPAAEAPAVSMEEIVKENGAGYLRFRLLLPPGAKLTVVLPRQEDVVYENGQTDCYYDIRLDIPKDCFLPAAPAETAAAEIRPELYLTAADGTVTPLDAGTFTMTFPEAFFEFTDPASVPEEGIMCPEGNVLHIEGRANDHTLSVTANGQRLNVYESGLVIGDYVLAGEEAEEVTLTVSGEGFMTAAETFTVLPYVFIPKSMELSIEGAAADHMADLKTGKLTLKGRVSPGSELTVTCPNEDVWCGQTTVAEDGSFTAEIAFRYNIYGLFPVRIRAEQEGYTEEALDTFVWRMFADRKAFIKGYQKMRDYCELPASVTFEKLLEAPAAYGGCRLTGTVEEVTEGTDGLSLVRLSVRRSFQNDTVTVYAVNMDPAWNPADSIGVKYHLYATLNGLAADGESLSVIAWYTLPVD